MNGVIKSMRKTIVFAGRSNAGKSSLLNYLCGQEAAITSPVAGTTTDPVEKSMELRPLGPVLFIDTAGLDDISTLGSARCSKSLAALKRADVVVIVVRSGMWGELEDKLLAGYKGRTICILTHSKPGEPLPVAMQSDCGGAVLQVDSLDQDQERRGRFIDEFTAAVAAVGDANAEPPLLGDIVPSGGNIILVVPLDIQAPKGRLILPQQQCLRDALDHDCYVTVCKAGQYEKVLKSMSVAPDLVVCDSQVVKEVTVQTPPEIPLTTFSILFSRFKGNIKWFMEGIAAIGSLADGDKILVAEACTHHASCEDIGRVKIPRMLLAASGKKLDFDFCSGHDFPEKLSQYKVIVHCGSCMLNRRETVNRLESARSAGVPVVNYGMLISYCQGVLERAVAPLPEIEA